MFSSLQSVVDTFVGNLCHIVSFFMSFIYSSAVPSVESFVTNFAYVPTIGRDRVVISICLR